MEINSGPIRNCVMETTFNNQKGAVLVIFTLLLVVLLGFAGLAIDVGSWYGVKAELSKSVDAAAMAGAKNISNPYVDPLVLAREFGRENFPAGYLGTKGTATFNAYADPDHRIRVTGSVIASAYLAPLFGVNQVVSTNTGTAKKNNVEIMLVLDRSGSMDGNKIRDLKTAAKSFIAFFKDTQDDDKVGLISFATGVKVDFSLGNNFVTPITTAINSMAATGATNAEDALAQAGGPQGLPDQSGLPGDQRVQQFLIFFSDGMPTAFRGMFRREGKDYDAVVMGIGNNCDSVYSSMGYPTTISYSNDSSNYYSTSTLVPTPTGDGNSTTGTPRTACSSGSGRNITYTANTRWYVFSDSKYGIANPTQCLTTTSQLAFLPAYICTTARQMAEAHAQELKNKYVKIYTIGLGNDIDEDFLSQQIATDSTYYSHAPTSSDLEGIFNKIAKDIKLRLVQ